MTYVFLILVVALQWGAYRLLEKHPIFIRKWMVLMLFVLGHLTVFPMIFYPELYPNGLNCGMPILGLHLFFCLFGIPLTLITHIVDLWKAKKAIRST